MNCRAVIDWLLDAEPAKLAGRGNGPVAEHIRSCAHCRAAAERLLDAHAALAAELTAPPRIEVDEAIERVLLPLSLPHRARPGQGGGEGKKRARAGAATPPPPHLPGGGGGEAGATAGGGRAGMRLRARRLLRGLAPLAAAAVIALLLMPHGKPPLDPLDAAGTLSLEPARPPAVIAPAGRNAALFHTSNPRITVVWIY